MYKFISIFLVLHLAHNSTSQIWVNKESCQGDFSSAINASTKNAQGEVLLCGYTMNAGSNKDILLMKINNSGDTLWTKTYDGPGNGMDEALDVVTDVNNNIYVIGYQRGNGTGTDMATLKFDTNGQLVWVQSYLSNINTDQTDRGNSLAVDQSGNVYVTGQTDIDASSVNNDNFITIKYGPAGTLIWSVLKNGLGNGTDRPVKLVLDAQNNVFITGRSFNGFDDDYLTIKYSGSNGAVLWEKLLDRTHHDRPTDMVINPQNGNVYVTGRSRNINYDYVTVAYNSSGSLIWQSVYDYLDDDRATNICLDANANVIVTGQSDFDLTANFNYNITTVKYNGLLGTQLWSSNYIGTLGTDDIPYDVITDNQNNVYVLGSRDTDPLTTINLDFIVQKISSSGSSLSTNVYSFSSNSNDVPSSILMGAQNNIIITGSSELAPVRRGIYIQLATGALTTNWEKKYESRGDNSNNSHAMIIDNQGNSFVAGYGVQYQQDRNYLLKKINPFGQTLWTNTLSGTSTSGSVDEAMSIGMDALGFIYTCGFVKNSGTSYDIKLVKYSSLGDTIWTRSYDYASVNASDKSYSLTIDPSGFIYLTGKSDSDPSTASNEDVITQKWDLNGNLIWTTRYNGQTNSNDVAKICASSASGVYVAGRTFNGVDFDGLLIKYNPSGVQQWVKIIAGTGNDEINTLNLDQNGNIIVSGIAQSIGADTNLITLKYDANGNQLWNQVFDGASHGTDIGKYVVTDQSGNVFVCGNTDSDASSTTLNNDILLLKYDVSGNLIWQQTYSATPNSDDLVEELRLNAANEIMIVGESDSLSSNGSNYDFITLSYNSLGVLTKSFRYEGIALSKDIPSTMFVNNAEIFVSGGSINQNQQRELLTIKYSTDPNAGLNENAANMLKLYPNPAEGIVNIELENLSIPDKFEMSFSNMNGQLFDVNYLTTHESIFVDVSNLPNNVYILTISFDSQIVKEKVIILNK
jgi:hypothetical protein